MSLEGDPLITAVQTLKPSPATRNSQLATQWLTSEKQGVNRQDLKAKRSHKRSSLMPGLTGATTSGEECSTRFPNDS